MRIEKTIARLTACFALILCVRTGRAAVLSVVSEDGGTLGAEHSGYLDDGLAVGTKAPVDDAGSVVFLSRVPFAGGTLDTYNDWDIYWREAGGDVAWASLHQSEFLLEPPPGQATAVAYAGGICAEVRENSLDPPFDEVLLWRSLSSKTTFTAYPGSGTQFEHPMLSDAGDFLVFAAGDGGAMDIYLQQLSFPNLTRITATAGDDCEWPDVSNDGGLVVFVSEESSLISGDWNNKSDIFLWTGDGRGTLTRVNLRYEDRQDGYGLQTSEPGEQPVITGDGSGVFYVSADAYLVQGDTNGQGDVFRYDTGSGTTRRVSVDTDGNEAQGGDCDQPDCNSTGRFVVFRSNATNFPGANGGYWQIYLYDVEAEHLRCLSVDDSGAGADADCYGPAISPSGRYVTFSTVAANLTDDGGNGYTQVILCDRGENYLNYPPTAQDVLVNCQMNENGGSNHCQIALLGADAETVAADLDYTLGDVGAVLAAGTLTDGQGAVSASGHVVNGSDLPLTFTPNDDFVGDLGVSYTVSDGLATSGVASVFITVADYDFGDLRLASLRDGTQVQGSGRSPAWDIDRIGISGDGRWIAFTNDATDLTADSAKGIFVRDVAQNRTFLLKELTPVQHYPVVALDGSAVAYVAGGDLCVQALGEDGPVGDVVSIAVSSASNLSISADGSVVVFDTGNRLLPEEDTDDYFDVYAWYPGTDTPVLVSSDGVGEPTAYSCSQPCVSGDGRVVAFVSQGGLDGELPSGNWSLWVKYLDSDEIQRPLGAASSDLSRPSLSWTGRYAAFQASGDVTSVQVADLLGSERAAVVATVSNAAYPMLSVDGRFLYLTSERRDLSYEIDDMELPPDDPTPWQAYRYDLTTGLVRLLSGDGIQTEDYGDAGSLYGVFSQTGGVAAFVSNATILEADTNSGGTDVYRMDLGDVTNALPTAGDVAVGTDEDVSVEVTLDGSDTEDNDLQYEIVSGPSKGTLGEIVMPEAGDGPDPTLTYTPATNSYGTDTFTYRCRDASGWSDVGTVTVTVAEVNDDPEWDWGTPPSPSVAEGAETRVDLRAYVSDPDTLNAEPERDTLVFAISDDDGASWASIDGDNGYELVLVPGYDVASKETPSPAFDIQLTVRDEGDPIAAPSVVTVTVTDVDRPPVVNSVSIAPAAPETADDLVADVDATDPDGDDVTITYQWYLGGAAEDGQTGGSVAAADTAKGQEWTVQVKAGAAGVETDWTEASAVTVLNSAPTIDTVSSLATPEDTAVEFDVDVSDDDAGETLSLVIVQPANGVVTDVTSREQSSGSYRLRYAPKDDYFSPAETPDEVTIRAYDGTTYSGDVTVSVTVSAVNDAPVLSVTDDLRLAPGVLTGGIGLSDDGLELLQLSDVDNDLGTELSVTLVTAPEEGHLTDSGRAVVTAGTEITTDRFPLTYHVDTGDREADTMVFQASDGELESEAVTVRVLIAAVSADITLVEGWNMISLPFNPDITVPGELFADDGVPLFIGPVWAFDAVEQAYVRTTVLAAKKGYWLYCPESSRSSVTVHGFLPDDADITLEPGWSLIGPTGTGEAAERPEDARGRPYPRGWIWEWNGTGYDEPAEDLLLKGVGYWVKAAEQHTISPELGP